MQYLFHKFGLNPTGSRDEPGCIILLIVKDSYRPDKIASAVKKRPMAAAWPCQTNHLGVGGVDDMTLVTVQGSEVQGSGLKPFFRASELQTSEP